MSKSAKEMFEDLGYEYDYVIGISQNCENVILYTHKEQDLMIQFNLLSKIVVYQIKNNMKEYDKIALFITKELIKAINQQCKELGWLDE